MSANPYAVFGDIVCINLETVPERRKYAQDVFHRLGIPARFFTAKRHPQGGRYGCFDSHIQVVRRAYDAGLDTVLVFEDDIVPTPACTPDGIAPMATFMKTDRDWDILYLGYIPCSMAWAGAPFLLAPLAAPGILRYNPITAHALCYSRRGMHKILHGGYEDVIGKIHYDIWLARLGLRTYCCLPMLFEQQFSFSSSIPAYNLLEQIARSLAPFLEKHLVFYRISVAKKLLLENQIALVILVIAMLVVRAIKNT